MKKSIKGMLMAALLTVCLSAAACSPADPTKDTANTYEDVRFQKNFYKREYVRQLIASKNYEKALEIIVTVPSDLRGGLDNECRYMSAADLAEKGDFQAAADLFNQCINYKDSEDKLRECWLDALDSIEEGTKVVIGKFDNNLLSWTVEKRESNRVMLVCDSIVTKKTAITGAQPPNQSWAEGSLRAYLNSDFINKAFSEGEKARIAPTHLITEMAGTKEREETEDKIFILSGDEVRSLVHSEKQLETTYWAREAESLDSKSHYIIDQTEHIVNSHPGTISDGIRPAMWIVTN